jgi:hypothetical protein
LLLVGCELGGRGGDGRGSCGISRTRGEDCEV